MAINTHQIVVKNNTLLSNQDFNVSDYQLILAFGTRSIFEDEGIIQTLLSSSTDNHVIMCSTSGQIADTYVHDEGLVLTGISFEHTNIEVVKKVTDSTKNSHSIGQQLAQELPKEELAHVLIFSDGNIINGSELLKGLNQELPENVKITGGMAGDDAQFERTLVGYNSTPEQGNVVAIGFYGKHLEVSYAYGGGFDPFGPYRKITKSKDNVLFELDDKNALSLYKKYLGDLAAKLPGSALFFPLAVTLPSSDATLVRTILSVDEEANTMTFAGDVPEGSTARLMRSNIEHVVDAAEDAAQRCLDSNKNNRSPQFALLISCVGRKLIMNQRVEEETEIIKEVLGDTTITGFYSNGEICPVSSESHQYSDLHNQTMTITTFWEL